MVQTTEGCFGTIKVLFVSPQKLARLSLAPFFCDFAQTGLAMLKPAAPYHTVSVPLLNSCLEPGFVEDQGTKCFGKGVFGFRGVCCS